MAVRRTLLLILTALLTGASCTPGDPGGDQNPGDNSGGDNNNETTSLPVLADPPLYEPDDTLVPAPVLAARALLNEVRHQAVEPDAPFVELKGASNAELAAGLSLLNENGDTYVIPSSVSALDDSGLVTIYFDGQNTVVPGVVHADRTEFLNTVSGFVLLRDASHAELDRIAWGNDRADAVVLRGTGVISVPPGVSLARRPASITPSDDGEWYMAAPIDITPERPNRLSGANILFPLDGAIILANDARFDWEFVNGAVQFELQIASDSSFAAPVVSQVIQDGPVTVPLPPGGYYWRVQAGFADGSLADWSPINRIIIVESEPEQFLPPQESGKAIVTQATMTRLTLSHPVPLYYQRKDTRMLLLESDTESGPHAWDTPHPTLDKNDPADNTNCALAAISMVNGYYAHATSAAPNLSQDRISLEIRQKHQDLGFPGPEFDLGFGRGLADAEYSFGIEFALGAPPQFHWIDWFATLVEKDENFSVYIPLFREEFWRALDQSINADKPMVISAWMGAKGTYAHGIAVAGRYVMKDGTRVVLVNDPWHGAHPVLLQHLKVRAYWILPDAVTPRADEEDFRNNPQDTDGDGIMDFDEKMRFKTRYTDPDKDRDTDQDCVEDLAEIRTSVFNKKHGWGRYWSPIKRKLTNEQEPPPKSDGTSRQGKTPELDSQSEPPDTDEGGLPDTVEDLDLDGMVDPDETDPGDPQDDPTKVTGYHLLFRDWDDTQSGVHTLFDRRLEFDLKIMPGGEVAGTAGVTHHYTTIQNISVGTQSCPPRTRTTTMPELKYTQKIKGRFVCQALLLEAQDVTSLPLQDAIVDDVCNPGIAKITIVPFGSANLGNPVSGSNGTIIYKRISPVRSGNITQFDWEVTLSK